MKIDHFELDGLNRDLFSRPHATHIDVDRDVHIRLAAAIADPDEISGDLIRVASRAQAGSAAVEVAKLLRLDNPAATLELNLTPAPGWNRPA